MLSWAILKKKELSKEKTTSLDIEHEIKQDGQSSLPSLS